MDHRVLTVRIPSAARRVTPKDRLVSRLITVSGATSVIVTHNMQQASRVSDFTGFFLMGEMIGFGHSAQIFTRPTDKRTEDSVTGRFG